MDPGTEQGYWCRTTFSDSVMTSFTWTIENFQNREEKFKERISSSLISVKGSDNRVSKWVFDIFPKGKTWYCNGGVRIDLTSKNDFPVRASWDMCILNRNSKQKFKRSAGSHTFETKEAAWGFDDVLMQSDMTDKLLPNGNLTLMFEITVYSEGKNLTNSMDYNNINFNFLRPDQRHKQVCDHLGQVLADKEFCDVEIQCEESVFPCHQLVLAARSPVFRAMLQVDMKEKQTKKIVIEDSKPEIVSQMLNFIYTGDIANEKLDDMASDLLAVGEKYQLIHLTKMCEDNLCSTLDVDNSIKYLVLGDIYNLLTLKTLALELAAKNMKKIVDTDVYKDLFKQKPELAWEVNKLKIQEDV